MTSDAEALAAGERAAQYAHDVANKASAAADAQSSGGGILATIEHAASSAYHAVVDPVTNAVHDAAQTIQHGEDTATDFGKSIVDALKWIGIVLAVIIGALLVLWMLVVLTSARWALSTLEAIAPHVATSAAAAAKMSMR